MDITVNARPRNGFAIQGGISTGRRSSDSCEIMEKLPETQLVFGIFAIPRGYCHVDEAFQTQGKVLATYLVPKIDVQFGVTFQSAPGPPLAANLFVLPFQAGLPSFSAAGVRLIDLIPITQPQPFSGPSTTPSTNGSTEYVHRANQLDLRFGKILRFAQRRAAVNLDVYNVSNANAVLTESQAYASFRVPQTILIGRFVKVSMQLDF